MHLKSKLDNHQIDPLGTDRRTAELNTLVQLYQERLRETQTSVPILIGGDFNGVAQLSKFDPEFSALYTKTSLRDALELIDYPLTDRFTHMTTGRPYHRVMNQIDYLFLPPELKDTLNKEQTYVYRFQTESGQEIRAPMSVAERSQLPSDHYPLVCELDLSRFNIRQS